MSWRDELQPASFRGVAFEAVELSREGGRRFVADDTSQGEGVPRTVDLGPVRRSFSLRGFVVGDDYLDRRDALVAALEKAGPGELVVPWRGRILVQAGTHRIVHQGHNTCTIDFECVEHGGASRPFVAPAPSTVTDDVIEQATTETVTTYTASAALTGKAYILEVGKLDKLGPIFGGKLLSAVTSNDEWNEDEAAALAEYFGLCDDLNALLVYVESALSSWGPAFGPSTEARYEALAEMESGCRLLALIRVCEIATSATYLSAEAAEQRMGEVVGALDGFVEAASGDLFVSLTDLRSEVVDSLSATITRLPRLKTIVVPSTRPALVVSFDEYGVTGAALEARERQVINLNSIGHPGFVRGPIEVLER